MPASTSNILPDAPSTICPHRYFRKVTSCAKMKNATPALMPIAGQIIESASWLASTSLDLRLSNVRSSPQYIDEFAVSATPTFITY